MAVRKIPMRKCIACGVQKPKKELIRIVRTTPSMEIHVDVKGKVNGRGAYICNDQSCFDTAIKKKTLQRALEIEITNEQLENLKQEWMELVHGGK